MMKLFYRPALVIGMVLVGCSSGGGKANPGDADPGQVGGEMGGAGGGSTIGPVAGIPAAGGDTGSSGPAVYAGTLGASVGTLELYGTFHSMGVIATLPAGSDSNKNAVASVDYRSTGSADYMAGFPLTRVDATTFIGSLLWLVPGTSYDVRVRYTDPDGGSLDKGWVSASAATRAEIVIPAPTRQVVVSPEGTGSACTVAAPCALSQAISKAQAGDEILLGAGTYSVGEMAISKSGTATAPIVIRGADAATTILDGADPGPFTWTSKSGGVYATTVNRGDPHLLAANGARLYPYADASALTALSASNTPGFFANGTAVSVHLAGGANPANVAMTVSRYNYAFQISGSFVYLINLTFQNYGLGDYAKAIYIRDGSDNLVRGCRFITNDLGIGIKGNAARNVIEENDFSDTIAGWTWEDVKAEGSLETGGVRFYDPADGRGTVIRRNKFHNFFDGLGICPNSSAAKSNETDFYDNESYNLGDDGVETDGRCVNVRLWGNVIHDTLAGISLAPVEGGPVYCLRNRIFLTGAGINQAGYTGLPFKFNSGDGDSGAIYLLHNTVDAQRAGNNGFAIMSPGTWTMLYARNNVFAGTLQALVNANPKQPMDMDYDDLWRSGGDPLVRWDGLSNPRLATLAEYTAATSQEAHGISAAPGFTAPASADFTPAPASPLVDRGLYIPGINDGYKGTAPDIGAVESQ
jgi:parallel beta-helix repeat protein